MARTALDRFALPADAVLSPCTRCREHVETLDSRGRCDDCAGDWLLSAVEEVSLFDVTIADGLAGRSFRMRLARVAVVVGRPAAVSYSASSARRVA